MSATKEFTMEEANKLITNLVTIVETTLQNEFDIVLSSGDLDEFIDKFSVLHNYATEYKHQLG